MARLGGPTPALLVGVGVASVFLLALFMRRVWAHSRESEEERRRLSALERLAVLSAAAPKANSSSAAATGELFEEALGALESNAHSLPQAILLDFYGLYKQATEGDATGSEPPIYKQRARAKAVWNSFKGLSTEDAKAMYVRLALHIGILSSAPPPVPAASSTRGRPQTFGPVHSRPVMANEGAAADDSTHHPRRVRMGTDWRLPLVCLFWSACRSKGDAFCCQVASGDTKAVEAALRENRSLVSATGDGGMTALHFAADRGHLDIAKMLLAHGADVNYQDDLGETPLHVAIAAEQMDMVALLRKAGANMALKNSDGDSCDSLLNSLRDSQQDD
ncbi:acyl-CoA-binding domain-containing protein 2 [Cyclospora cayetanensis]|uniref:Acyl-CoA-binding domain-containing protein 2 n=1 Tax=Cyclospora cayetanensis TaxID=88456 RepID=A0A6P6RR04_9EIME|nr:acyl-CoA-binding domain-containing protein 2 [Cyclospora cayetanensis]